MQDDNHLTHPGAYTERVRGEHKRRKRCLKHHSEQFYVRAQCP